MVDGNAQNAKTTISKEGKTVIDAKKTRTIKDATGKPAHLQKTETEKVE